MYFTDRGIEELEKFVDELKPDLIGSGKLQSITTVFNIEKILTAIRNKDFTGQEDGIPVLKYEDMKNGSPYPVSSYSSSYFNGTQDGLRWSNTYEIAKGYKASFGVEGLKDGYDASGNYGYTIHRNTKAYYGGLTGVVSDWTWQANVRKDNIDIDNAPNLGHALSSSKIGATSALLGAG